MSIINNIKVVPGQTIKVTRNQLLNLISNNELIANAHYEISETLDYFFKGSTITLQAIDSSTLNKKGIGKFYAPIYNPNSVFNNIWNNLVKIQLNNINGSFYDFENITLSNGGQAVLMQSNLMAPMNGSSIISGSTITGQWSGATATISSIMAEDPIYIDKVVIYGGSCWKNLTGNIGYDDSQSLGSWNGGLALNSSDWALIPYTNTSYYQVLTNFVEYEYKYDILTYREDLYQNKIYEALSNLGQVVNQGNTAVLLQSSNILYFPWGDSQITGNSVDNSSQFQMLNTMGQFRSNRIKNNSYVTINYSKGQWDAYPRNVKLQSNIFNNDFITCNLYNVNGDGYIADNVLDSTSIGSITRMQLNACQLKNSNINNGGYVYLSISNCVGEFYISDNKGYLNQSVQFNNCKGRLDFYSNTIFQNSVNFYGNDFGLTFGTTFSSNMIASLGVQGNKFSNINFSNNNFNRIRIDNNNLHYVEITNNTFDSSSYNGYDPQLGIVSCTNLSKVTFSFSSYNLKIDGNNFQGRSAIVNCNFENVIYFTNNSFNSSKIFMSTFVSNSAFTQNSFTNSNIQECKFDSCNFTMNTFYSSNCLLNSLIGYVANNNIDSSTLQGNKGGSNTASVLYGNFLYNGSQIKDNTFTAYGSIAGCELNNSSTIQINNISGSINGLKLDATNILNCTIQAGSNLQLINSGQPITGRTIIRLTTVDELYLPDLIDPMAAIFNTTLVKKLIARSGNIAQIEYFNGSGYTYTNYYNI